MSTFDVFDDPSSDLLESMGVNVNKFTPEEVKEEDKEIDKQEDKDDVVDLEKSVNPHPDGKNITDKPQNHILESLAEAIRDEGYVNEEDGEELKFEKPSDFVKFLDKIRDTALDVEQSDWSNHQKEYFNALKDGVPHEVIQQHQQRQDTYSSIKEEEVRQEENEELRKSILKAAYVMKGFTEVKADKLIKNLFDNGEDVDEALDMLAEIKANENAQFKAQQAEYKKQQEALNKKQQESTRELKAYADGVKEILPGVPITPKVRKEVYEAFTKPVVTKEDGQKLNLIGKFFDEASQQDLFNLVYILKYTDNLKKLETISPVKAKKEVTSKIDKVLSAELPSSLGFLKDDSNPDVSVDDLWSKMDKYL